LRIEFLSKFGELLIRLLPSVSVCSKRETGAVS